MFNYIIKFLLLIFVSFSLLANADDIKVFDKGLDGNMRIYSIGCPNGKNTVITQMFGAHGKAKRSNSATSNIRELQLEEFEETETLDTDLSGNSDEIPTSSSASTLTQTTSNIRQKFLKLIGQEARTEVCLYPVNAVAQCKSYQNIDTAAKAACDLIN